MILYFSATGNNKYIAQELAKALNDTAVSIQDKIANSDYVISLKEGESLGFVTPTYFYGLPSIVMDYFHQVKVNTKDHYSYLIASYGTSPGATWKFAENALKNTQWYFNAFFSVKMPDTWTPEFDLSDPDEVRAINDREPEQIAKILKQIQNREQGNFMHDRHSYPVSRVCYVVYETTGRKTKHFHVEDSCIGCGLCERKCPVQAISMKDGKPVWIKDKCVMCAGCLHRCPKFAIQYENKTQKHGQYKHPGITV